jgi:hypothetical protein
MRLTSSLALIALLAAAPTAPARAEEASAARRPRDYREVKLLKRAIADNRKDLSRLSSRRVRLLWLSQARVLDARAVGELDTAVQFDVEQRLVRQRLEARRGAEATQEVLRLEAVAADWKKLRGRFAPADLERRLGFLNQLIQATRKDLLADVRTYRELGGEGLPALPADEEDESEG